MSFCDQFLTLFSRASAFVCGRCLDYTLLYDLGTVRVKTQYLSFEKGLQSKSTKTNIIKDICEKNGKNIWKYLNLNTKEITTSPFTVMIFFISLRQWLIHKCQKHWTTRTPASAAGLIVFVIFIIKKFKARMLIKLRTERKANEMSGPGRT